MTRGSIWILLICWNVEAVNTETTDELLQALKQQYSQQPDCRPMFENRHPGYLSSNVTASPTSITTEDECKSSCIKDKKCMSYQIDSRPGQTFCRLQSSYSIEDLYGPFSAADVKEYVFTVKCVNTTSKEPCTPLIEVRLRHMNSHLAREKPSVKSELECRDLCVTDQNCMSYHIDSRPGHPSLCYIQKNLEFTNKYQLYRGEEVNEYFVVDRCLDKYVLSHSKECFPAFKKLFRPKEVSRGATPFPLITTEQLCRYTCVFKTDCKSYQINRNPGASFCSIQTNISNLVQDKRTSVDLVTEYILVNPCTNKPFDPSAPDCTPLIFPKPHPGVSYNAEPRAELKNSADCRAMCVATPSCVSYQISSSASVICWFQHEWTNLMPNRAYTANDVVEHAVTRRCSKEASPNPPIVFDEVKAVTPEIHTVDECMPSDMRSEIDIVFAVSIAGILKRHAKSEERLKEIKTFLASVIVSLNIGPNKDRVAMVTYETKPYSEFKLNSYNDRKLLAEAIARVACHECNATEANVIAALQMIKTNVLTIPNGYRPNVPHAIFLITDRLSSIDHVAINTLVKEFGSNDTFIIPIGVTDMVDAEKLKEFASPMSDGTPQVPLWVNSYTSLNTLIYRLHDRVLQVLPKKYLRFCVK